MESLATGEPVWELHFDEHGRLIPPTEADFLDQVLDPERAVTDLFVFSHGWGTAEDDAKELYQAMFPLIQQAVDGAGNAKIGFVGIYWPSLWFPPTPATPPQAAGGIQADGGAVLDLSAGTAQLSGSEIADALCPGFADPAQQDAIRRIGKLIDDGLAPGGSLEANPIKRQRMTEIHELVTTLVPPSPPGQFEDAGEIALLRDNDPSNAYQQAAETFGSAPAAPAGQDVGDWFRKALNGGKDVLRVLSYTIMKARAGEIGRTGLGPLLVQLHGRSSAVRVHLIGHSFGARLVAFALSGIDDAAQSPVRSLLLLQGAFSHWSFADAHGNPFGKGGALNAYPGRVHGPLVATFSSYDWAVGVWYPKASFLAGDDTQAAGPTRWGGLGADGFQGVSPLATLSMPAAGVADYAFAPGAFRNVDASGVINGIGDSFSGAHSDIRKPQVARLAAAAAGLGAATPG